jgi:hypothetical protein
MKKILIVVMALALMATGTKADWQLLTWENATTAYEGTQWTNASYYVDGNWGTFAEFGNNSFADFTYMGYYYVNYTDLSNMSDTLLYNTSLWEVKEAVGDGVQFVENTHNISLSICDSTSGIIMLRANVTVERTLGFSESGNVTYQCYNAGWQDVNITTGLIYYTRLYEQQFFAYYQTPTTTTSTSTTSSTSTTAPTTTTTIATTIPTTTIPTTILTTTTTIPMNISCHMCNITNIGPEMGLGALVWAPICGFLEILFCVPILFALALIGVTFIAAWLSIRRR